MKIDLGKNRYEEHVTIEDNMLLINGSADIGHIRILFKTNPEDILGIDPPGGPMLGVGDTIKGHIIKSIEKTEKGFKINF